MAARKTKCNTCGGVNPAESRFCNNCGGSLVSVAPLDGLIPEGTVLRNTYILGEVVGEGGMGVVYMAQHKTLGSRYAIKVLDSKLARLGTLRQRFLEEARIQATLTHPNIVKVHDILDEGGVFGMVMEYIEGQTLDGYIHDAQRKIGFAEARTIAIALLDAIGHAHAAGVVHRDIKPSNVLLVASESAEGFPTAKVMDFGIAKVLEGEARTMTGAKMGTPRYMAPEQVRNARDVDERSDVYALGLTLYEMVCGRSPYEELRDYDLLNAHVEGKPPAPSSFRPDLPEALEDIILKALEKDPERRFQTAQDFADALRSLPLGGAPDKTRSPRRPQPAKQSARQSQALTAKAPHAAPNMHVPTDDSWASELPAGEWSLGDTSIAETTPFEDADDEPRSHTWTWALALVVLLAVGGVSYRMLGPHSNSAAAPQAPLSAEQIRGGGAADASKQPTNVAARPIAHVETLPTSSGKMSLIPGGRYLVGRVEGDTGGASDERPGSTLETGAYYVDQAEVPVYHYQRCVADGKCPPLGEEQSAAPNNPVTGVGIGSAEAFCQWAGKRLPTEDEWEIAARSGQALLYPTAEAPTCWQANYGTGDAGGCVGTNRGGAEGVYDRETGKTSLHLRHMAGNAAEWTTTPGRDAQTRVVKGGSYKSDVSELRVSARRHEKANSGAVDVGFRCVMASP